MEHLTVTIAVGLVCLILGALMWLGPLAKAQAKLHESDRHIDELTDALAEIPADTTVVWKFESESHTDRFAARLYSQARSGLDQPHVGDAIEYTANSLFAEAIWPRFYAHIAVYIGLLGTILGLWFALNELQGSTQIHDEATLTTFAASTQALLGSLQGAFVSALAGVLVTAALGALVQRYDRACESYLERLDLFARKELIPRLEQVRLGILPHTGVEAAKAIVTQLDKTLGSFTKAWAERFKTLADHSALISDTTERLANSAKNIESATDSFADAAETLDGRLSGLTEETRRLSERSAQTLGMLTEATEAVRTLSERAVQWPDIAHQLSETSSGVADASTSVREAANGLKEATFDLVQIVENLRSNVQELSQESYRQLTNAVLKAISDVVSHAGDEISGLSAAAQEREERIAAMVEQVEAASKKQASLAGEMALAVHQMLALLPAMEDPRPTLETLLARLSAVSEAVSRAADAIGERQVDDKRLMSDGAPVEAQFQLLIEEMSRVKDEVSAISATVSQYRAVGESASRHLEQIARAVSTQSEAGVARAPDSQPSQRRKVWPFGRS